MVFFVLLLYCFGQADDVSRWDCDLGGIYAFKVVGSAIGVALRVEMCQIDLFAGGSSMGDMCG